MPRSAWDRPSNPGVLECTRAFLRQPDALFRLDRPRNTEGGICGVAMERIRLGSARQSGTRRNKPNATNWNPSSRPTAPGFFLAGALFPLHTQELWVSMGTDRNGERRKTPGRGQQLHAYVFSLSDIGQPDAVSGRRGVGRRIRRTGHLEVYPLELPVPAHAGSSSPIGDTRTWTALCMFTASSNQKRTLLRERSVRQGLLLQDRGRSWEKTSGLPER